MYGKDWYTEDKKPPEGFLRRLKGFDPALVCAWNAKRGIFEILRPRDPETVKVMAAQGTFEPYDVVLECAETRGTKILDAEGVECAVRVPKDPSDWVFQELRKRDTWQAGVADSNAAFMEHFRQVDAEKVANRNAFFEAHQEEGYAAVCRDLNVARTRVPIGVTGYRSRIRK